MEMGTKNLPSAIVLLLLVALTSACDGGQVPATATPTTPPPTPTERPAGRNVVLVSSEYPPYFGSDLENYGVLTEIIVVAYQRAGYEVSVEFRPWARALKETQEGKFDGMFALWYRPEREEWFVFSDPMVPNEIGFYKRKSAQITFESFEDLKPYVIGVVRGYANPPGFEEATYLNKEEVADDETNIKKLYHQRVDLILIDKGLARYIIDRKYPEYRDSLEWMEPALEVIPEHLVISKLTPDYQTKMADFNAGLKSITDDGTRQQILDKHGF